MADISALSIVLSNPRLAVNQKLIKLCYAVKQAIPTANRVGIWLFNADHSEMISLACLDEHNTVSNGLELFANDYQRYFDHILTNQFLVADNAQNHEIASCFNQGYFDVYDIHSLLDITFNYDFKPLGIICCERTGAPTNWSDDDLAKLKRLANVTSIFLAENVSQTYSAQSKTELLVKLSQSVSS
ncbi:GAF domain-containing protein [Colwellia sp. MEBiC06753]